MKVNRNELRPDDLKRVAGGLMTELFTGPLAVRKIKAAGPGIVFGPAAMAGSAAAAAVSPV